MVSGLYVSFADSELGRLCLAVAVCVCLNEKKRDK